MILPTDLLAAVNELDPVPPPIWHLVSILLLPDATLRDIVESDADHSALTNGILHWASFTLFADPSPFENLPAAIARVGRGPLAAAVLAPFIRAQMRKGRLTDLGVDEDALWQHNIAGFMAVGAIAALTRVPEEAYAAALMHDFGKVVLAPFLGEAERSELERAQTEKCLTPIQAETRIFGLHHGELGGAVARRWKLPVGIMQGIQYHHTPDLGERAACDVVCLANELAHFSGVDQPLFAASLRSAERLGLSSGHLKAICLAIQARVAHAQELTE